MRTILVAITLSFVATSGAAAQDSLLKRGKGLLDTLSRATPEQNQGLSTSEIGDGLKEALRVGTERVVGTLGQIDGFNADPEIHIPLPENLQKVQKALSRIRASGLCKTVGPLVSRGAPLEGPTTCYRFDRIPNIGRTS